MVVSLPNWQISFCTISEDHPVLSGVPQGTGLGPLLFLIMISHIDKDVSESKLVSFADDTRLYFGVGDVTDCDNPQLYLILYMIGHHPTTFLTKKV